MINLDITLVVQMINFLVLLFVLNKILFRPIRNIIKERNQIVEDFNSDITSLTDQAQDLRVLEGIDNKYARNC